MSLDLLVPVVRSVAITAVVDIAQKLYCRFLGIAGSVLLIAYEVSNGHMRSISGNVFEMDGLYLVKLQDDDDITVELYVGNADVDIKILTPSASGVMSVSASGTGEIPSRLVLAAALAAAVATREGTLVIDEAKIWIDEVSMSVDQFVCHFESKSLKGAGDIAGFQKRMNTEL